MRMPNETLEDFKSRIAAPIEPPRGVWLKLTGDIEVLKPLARTEDFVKTKAAAAASASPVPHRPPRFPRSLAVAGALAMTALILGTGLLIAFYGPPVEPVSPIDVASEQSSADILAPSEELDDSDLLSAVDSPFAVENFFAVRKVPRPRRVSSRLFRSVYRPQIVQQPRPVVPRPRFIVSEFVPTTLIIYIENGEIKTRIEPQLTAGYKKPSPLPN